MKLQVSKKKQKVHYDSENDENYDSLDDFIDDDEIYDQIDFDEIDTLYSEGSLFSVDSEIFN